METAKKFTLTATDLTVILNTLGHSLAISGDWQTPRQARKIVHDKIEDILHGMEATFTVNSEEPQ
jgi:hypothetical protein